MLLIIQYVIHIHQFYNLNKSLDITGLYYPYSVYIPLQFLIILSGLVTRSSLYVVRLPTEFWTSCAIGSPNTHRSVLQKQLTECFSHLHHCMSLRTLNRSCQPHLCLFLPPCFLTDILSQVLLNLCPGSGCEHMVNPQASYFTGQRKRNTSSQFPCYFHKGKQLPYINSTKP